MRPHTYAGHVHYYDRGVRVGHKFSMTPTTMHGKTVMRLTLDATPLKYLEVPRDDWQRKLALEAEYVIASRLPKDARELTVHGKWTQQK